MGDAGEVEQRREFSLVLPAGVLVAVAVCELANKGAPPGSALVNQPYVNAVMSAVS